MSEVTVSAVCGCVVWSQGKLISESRGKKRSVFIYTDNEIHSYILVENYNLSVIFPQNKSVMYKTGTVDSSIDR